MEPERRESRTSPTTTYHTYTVDVGEAGVESSEWPGWAPADAVTPDFGEPYATVIVEYRPRDYVVVEPSIRRLVRNAIGNYDAAEAFVEDLYLGLVEALYPGYEARDEPWEYCPMLVAVEYGWDDRSTVTLGSP
jgi:hypothetical protein